MHDPESAVKWKQRRYPLLVLRSSHVSTLKRPGSIAPRGLAGLTLDALFETPPRKKLASLPLTGEIIFCISIGCEMRNRLSICSLIAAGVLLFHHHASGG